jgi:hypothetical protein
VAKLHHHEVAGLEHFQNSIPVSARDKGAAAGSTQRAIHDIYFVGIEMRADEIAPAPLAVGAITATVANGGISDQEQRGK